MYLRLIDTGNAFRQYRIGARCQDQLVITLLIGFLCFQISYDDLFFLPMDRRYFVAYTHLDIMLLLKALRCHQHQ